jgi:hypothetical protein
MTLLGGRRSRTSRAPLWIAALLVIAIAAIGSGKLPGTGKSGDEPKTVSIMVPRMFGPLASVSCVFPDPPPK